MSLDEQWDAELQRAARTLAADVAKHVEKVD